MYVPAHLASLIHGLPSQHRRHGSGSGTLPAGRGRDTLHPSPSSPGSSPAVTVQPQAGCSGHTHSCLLRERLSFAVLPSRSSPRGTGSMGSLWDLSVPVQGMAGSAQALLCSAEFHLAGTNPAPQCQLALSLGPCPAWECSDSPWPGLLSCLRPHCCYLFSAGSSTPPLASSPSL